MDATEALKNQDFDIRLKNVNCDRWMIWDDLNRNWIVRTFEGTRKQKVKTLYDGPDESEAIRTLING